MRIQTWSCIRYTTALRNRSLRVVIVFRHRWGDLDRSFSSVARTECILSVGAVDSVDEVLLHGCRCCLLEKAAIVDFPCVVEGMRHMFSLIPLGSDIFDTEFLRCLDKMGGRAYFGGEINSAPTGRDLSLGHLCKLRARVPHIAYYTY